MARQSAFGGAASGDVSSVASNPVKTTKRDAIGKLCFAALIREVDLGSSSQPILVQDFFNKHV
jgi:hypothetical protein